ncbi:MAG: POTRA domain-containing protein [Myxococcota bacterium]
MRLALIFASLACGAGVPRGAVEVPAECGDSLDVDPGEDGLGDLGEPAPASPVVEVRVDGLVSVPESVVRDTIQLPIGPLLSEEAVRADVRRLLSLRVFEDIRVHVEHVEGGVAVTYAPVERPLVVSAMLIGESASAVRRRVERMAGEVFRPGRLHRLSQRIADDRRRDGYAEASARVTARRVDGGVALCVIVDPGRRWVVDRLTFEGNDAIDDDALLAAMDTREGRVNVEGGIYFPDALETDLQRMRVLYLDAGHAAVEVESPEVRWDGDSLRVAVRVREGPVFTLRHLTVSGDLSGSVSEYLAFLDLDTGVRFDRSVIASAIDRLRVREQARGNVQVEPIVEMEGNLIDVNVRVEDLDAEDPATLEDAAMPEDPATPRGSSIEVQLLDRELSLEEMP